MRSSIANRRSSSTSLSQPISCTTWRSPNPSLASAPPADPGDAACAVEPTVLSPSCLVCVSPALHAPGVGSTVVGDSGTRHHMHILWTGSRAYSGSVGRVTRRAPAARYEVTDGDQPRVVRRPDTLAVEEPMEICVDTDADGSPTYNVVDVTLRDGMSLRDNANRAFVTTSACGVCGTASIDALQTTSRYAVAEDSAKVDPAVLCSLPGRLRAAQKAFDRTGGIHAAGLFTINGELLVVREDVGRHNAVDKVVGWALREGRVPLTGHV